MTCCLPWLKRSVPVVEASAFAEVGAAESLFRVNVEGLRLEPHTAQALVGKSGCGKTLLLSTLIGLQGSARFLPRRPTTGAVLHVPYLFPWLTLREFLSLEAEAREEKMDTELFRRALDAFALHESVLDLRSWQISHGMRQRFELAKALAFHPAVVYLDEAFSGVEAGVRLDIFRFLDQFLTSQPISLLFVTHDLGDVMRLADSILVMQEGRIVTSLNPQLARARRIVMAGSEIIELATAKKLAELLF